MAKALSTRPETLFDRQPIKFAGGFEFRSRRVTVSGRPSIAQWTVAMQFAMETEESAPFWIGDLYNYAEQRDDWRETLQQALADVGRPLSLKTLTNMGYIARNIADDARPLAPSLAHAGLVVSLPDKDQVKWLRKAQEEELTVRDLDLEVRATRRPKTISGQAVLEGLFRVVYADYPWLYDESWRSSRSTAQDHYPGMPIEDGLKLPVAAHVLPNAVLFFWVTAPFLYYATEPEKGPDAYRLIRQWGFEPKSQIIWDKVDHNRGHYVSVRHEILIIATRGSCTPDRVTPMQDSVVTERVRGLEHSEKPESFRQLIMKLYDGPFLELFARKRTDGWTSLGNDCRLWHQEAVAGQEATV